MSRFTGPQGRGALKRRRERLRLDAIARNAQTPPERRSTRAARRLRQASKAAAADLLPVAEEIARSVRVDLVAWLEGHAGHRKRGTGHHIAVSEPAVWLEWTPLPPVTVRYADAFRVPAYVLRRAV